MNHEAKLQYEHRENQRKLQFENLKTVDALVKWNLESFYINPEQDEDENIKYVLGIILREQYNTLLKILKLKSNISSKYDLMIIKFITKNEIHNRLQNLCLEDILEEYKNRKV